MLNPLPLILKKRDHLELTSAEIQQLIDAFAVGEVPDYQMSAWAMAVACRGMTRTETIALTAAMRDSGETLRWDDDLRPVLDKHSTGGVGDKTSLVLVPLLASVGVRVPKLSGRGLGATGGTLDKLESIPGVRVELDVPQFQQQVADVGCAIVSTSQRLAPADKRLYALRDVSGSVESLPLIASSILSKKLAEGLDGVVFDVKHGRGALLTEFPEARELARTLVQVAHDLGTPAVALLSPMDQPLGQHVGHAGEVNEAVNVLQGGGPPDVRDLVLALGSQLLANTDPRESVLSSRTRLVQALEHGTAFEKFVQLIEAQGGHWSALLDLHPATELTCTDSGWLASIDGLALGQVVVELGGGRKRLGDTIDHRVGIDLLLKVGSRVEAGEPWCRVHHHQPLAESFQRQLQAAIVVQPTPTAGPPPTVTEVIHPS